MLTPQHRVLLQEAEESSKLLFLAEERFRYLQSQQQQQQQQQGYQQHHGGGLYNVPEECGEASINYSYHQQHQQCYYYNYSDSSSVLFKMPRLIPAAAQLAKR